jgi:hypothetical protein
MFVRRWSKPDKCKTVTPSPNLISNTLFGQPHISSTYLTLIFSVRNRGVLSHQSTGHVPSRCSHNRSSMNPRFLGAQEVISAGNHFVKHWSTTAFSSYQWKEEQVNKQPWNHKTRNQTLLNHYSPNQMSFLQFSWTTKPKSNILRATSKFWILNDHNRATSCPWIIPKYSNKFSIDLCCLRMADSSILKDFFHIAWHPQDMWTFCSSKIKENRARASSTSSYMSVRLCESISTAFDHHQLQSILLK